MGQGMGLLQQKQRKTFFENIPIQIETQATRLKCWSNVHQNNSIRSKYKNAEKKLQIDFENRQWSGK